jgi:hypothetical protein
MILLSSSKKNSLKNKHMYQEYRPWESVVTTHEGGAISIGKADEETRKRQLEEYKKKRIAELEAEILKVKCLF